MDELSPEIRAKRAADAKRYIDYGIDPQLTNPAGIKVFNEYLPVYQKEWEDLNGRPWSLEEVRNQGKRQVKPWTPEQRKSIEEKFEYRLNTMGQKLDRSVDELRTWLDTVQKLYEITADNEVISYARGDKMKNGKPQVWSFNSEAEAEDQIAFLLTCKVTDRRRGQGDIDKDLGNTPQL